jgi:hypothetical protein
MTLTPLPNSSRQAPLLPGRPSKSRSWRTVWFVSLVLLLVTSGAGLWLNAQDTKETTPVGGSPFLQVKWQLIEGSGDGSPAKEIQIDQNGSWSSTSTSRGEAARKTVGRLSPKDTNSLNTYVRNLLDDPTVRDCYQLRVTDDSYYRIYIVQTSGTRVFTFRPEQCEQSEHLRNLSRFIDKLVR